MKTWADVIAAVNARVPSGGFAGDYFQVVRSVIDDCYEQICRVSYACFAWVTFSATIPNTSTPTGGQTGALSSGQRGALAIALLSKVEFQKGDNPSLITLQEATDDVQLDSDADGQYYLVRWPNLEVGGGFTGSTTRICLAFVGEQRVDDHENESPVFHPSVQQQGESALIALAAADMAEIVGFPTANQMREQAMRKIVTLALSAARLIGATFYRDRVRELREMGMIAVETIPSEGQGLFGDTRR